MSLHLTVYIPGYGSMAFATFERLRRAVKNANGGPIWLDKSTTGLTTNTEKRWRTAERMELATLEDHGKRIKVTLTQSGESVLADQEAAK